MTYKESYLQLDSAEEIMKIANTDMAIAAVLNPDRIKIIRESADEAIKEKFGEKTMNEHRYKILINDTVVAENMDMEIVTILIKALFENYYNEHSMIVSIKEMDRVEGVK